MDAPKFEALLIDTHASGERHIVETAFEWNAQYRAWMFPESVSYNGYRYKHCGNIPDETRKDKVIPYYQSSYKLCGAV